MLPEVVFHDEDGVIPISVSSFQSNLTKLLKLSSMIESNWLETFSPRVPLFNHVLKELRQVDQLPELTVT